MFFYYSFSSWLFFMTFLHNFLSCFSIIAFLHDFPSWFSIITLYHNSLSKLSTKQSSCFSSCFSLCFSLWLSIKKIMQRRKTGKISIFSSLDIIFDCLTSRVKSASSDSTWDWYRVKSWDSTQVFESSQKIQLKYSSWVRM